MTLLNAWFDAFLRSRRAASLFRRRALPDAGMGRGAAGAVPTDFSDALRRLAQVPVAAALAAVASHPDGLASDEADARLAHVGPNEIDHEKPLPWWRHLWQCYRNPFNLLLTLLAVVSWLTEDAKATVVIGTMVMLSTLIRFIQEGRSNRAAERLKALVGNNARVLRRPDRDAAPLQDTGAEPRTPRYAQQRSLPIRALVPGDHIVLSAGDMIPADCRVLNAKDLFVAQAAMTGESLPVEKFAAPDTAQTNLLEQPNLLFMGTNVVSGSATAVVLATGNRTCFGTIASAAPPPNARPPRSRPGSTVSAGC